MNSGNFGKFGIFYGTIRNPKKNNRNNPVRLTEIQSDHVIFSKIQ